MAISTDFRGFEAPPAGLDPDLTDYGSSVPTADGTAWSGLRYLRLQVLAAQALGGVGLPAATFPAPGVSVPFDYRMEIFFRVKALPSVTHTFVAGTLDCRLEMDTQGHLRVLGPPANASAYSSGLNVLPADSTTWYRLVLRSYGVGKAATPNCRRIKATAQIYRAIGNVFLFSLTTPPQVGTGMSIGGDQATPFCQNLNGAFPFSRQFVTNGALSFQTMATLGLTGIIVTYQGGSTFPDRAASYNGFYDQVISQQEMARTGGCYPGAVGGTYTMIEQGILAPFGEGLSTFYIDDAANATAATLGQDGSGAVSARSFDYDAVRSVGATGADIPPAPPAPPALGKACPAFQPAPASDSIVPMPVPVF